MAYPINSVVGIYDTRYKFLCTGTLISSSTVLTAAHCIEKTGKLVVVFSDDVYKQVNLNHNPNTNKTIRKVISATPHPAYVPYDDTVSEAEEEKYENISDIAIVKFTGGLAEGYAPVKIDSSSPQKSELVLMAGFGVANVELIEVKGSFSHQFNQKLDSGEVVCFDDQRKSCHEVYMAGDGPLRSTWAPVLSDIETEFTLDEKKTGTCNGDSGGPVYRKEGDQYYVTGVTSRGSLMCDEYGVYTKVSSHLDWIKSFLEDTTAPVAQP